MSETRHDPFDEPQLAEGWAAFSQLLAAAEMPVDEARLLSNIASRLERRARRRRFVYGSVGLAAAASILVMASIYARAPRGERTVAVATGGDVSTAGSVATAPTDEVSTSTASFSPWVDELGKEVALLSQEAEEVQERWQLPPDSIALLQSQVDRFEEEMADSAL
jgi:hypothetical protein